MLYMLFSVSCNHSLKKSQIETKRVGNKRKSLQLQEVLPCAAHYSALKKIKKLKIASTFKIAAEIIKNCSNF